MSKSIKGTRTEANLLAAFAGESQARNKYTYYASRAKKDGYEQIARAVYRDLQKTKRNTPRSGQAFARRAPCRTP